MNERVKWLQCDQIGQFLKVVGYNFINKNGRIIWKFSRIL